MSALTTRPPGPLPVLPVLPVLLGLALLVGCDRSIEFRPLDYEAFVEIGAMIGHGGIVVFDDTV